MRPLFLFTLLALFTVNADARAEIRSLYNDKSFEDWMKDVRHGSLKEQLLAMKGLVGYSKETAQVIPLLREQLKSSNAFTQRQALESLVTIYNTVLEPHRLKTEDDCIAAMKDDPVTGAYGFERNATMKSLRLLTDALSHDDLVVRCFACQGLQRIVGAPIMPHYRPHDMAEVARVVEIWRAQADICLQPLIQTTKSKNLFLAQKAIEALACMSGYDNDVIQPAIPALVAALKSGDKRIVFAASVAFWRIGKPALAAVPELIEALKDDAESSESETWSSGISPNGPARMIIQALGSIGPAAKETTLPVIRSALQHKDSAIRKAAGFSIEEVGGVPNAIDELVAALGDSDLEIRQRAAYDLRLAGKDGTKAMPALIKALGDPYEGVRFSACCAVRDLAEFAADAKPALKKCAEKDDFVRHVAQEALKKVEQLHPE